MNEYGDQRTEGTRTSFTDEAFTATVTENVLTSVSDGVMVWHSVERHVSSINPEDRNQLYPYVLAGMLTGLGRGIDFKSMLSRGEWLDHEGDARVAVESSESITIESTIVLGNRRVVQRATLDSKTGLLRIHEFIGPRWGHVYTIWRVREWQTIDGVAVPYKTEYEVWSPKVTVEDLRAINSLLDAKGMSFDRDTRIESPRYREWLEIRSAYFVDSGGVAPQTNPTFQRATTTIKRINVDFTADELRANPPLPPDRIGTSAFESRLRSLDLDPANAIPMEDRP